MTIEYNATGARSLRTAAMAALMAGHVAHRAGPVRRFLHPARSARRLGRRRSGQRGQTTSSSPPAPARKASGRAALDHRFSSQTLSDANVRNLRDVAYLTPGPFGNQRAGSEVGVNRSSAARPTSTAAAGDPNVAVFIDGIYISNNTAINVGLVDIRAHRGRPRGPVSGALRPQRFRRRDQLTCRRSLRRASRVPA